MPEVHYGLCSGKNIEQLPTMRTDLFAFSKPKDNCTLWFLDISCFDDNVQQPALYLRDCINKKLYCILTPSAFEQYPHNLLSGHSIHQGSVLPRNLTRASHVDLPVGQSPACEHKRKGVLPQEVKRKIYKPGNHKRQILYPLLLLLTMLK